MCFSMNFAKFLRIPSKAASGSFLVDHFLIEILDSNVIISVWNNLEVVCIH